MVERKSGPADDASDAAALRVSVIVPTMNEAENIDALVEGILAASTPDLIFEVLVADGGSSDGTADRARAWQAEAPVRLIECEGGCGLAGDVLIAVKQSTAPIVVVMDADLSHAPASIPALVAPIAAGEVDMVVGSRYVPGGSTPDWPIKRRILSRCGSVLAWPLADIRDPLSGFFAVRREQLLGVDPAATGFKICLEALAAGGGELRVAEVPIKFTDREKGASKIGPRQFAAFVHRLMALSGGAVSAGTAARFAVVGVAGFAIDFVTFTILFAAGAGLGASHVVSFSLATIFNYLANALWTFAGPSLARPGLDLPQYTRFMVVCLMALFLRGGVLATAVGKWGWTPQAAILLAIAFAAIVNYLGNAFFVFPPANERISRGVRWRIAAIGIVAYVILLRLVFGGTVDLLPQEAYYWNYSQHLDIGYLDHPPMVAWLIWLGTAIGGNTEFAVRFGALLSWLIAGFFCFQLARNLYGKTEGFVAVLIFCALPFFFLTGMVMTPDTPLTAAWAGALYFLERALIGQRRMAWLGAGLCVGLGLLSKYTIILLLPATLVLLLLDPRLRAWFLRPEPYLAAVVAAIVFSPVILWNATNGWASFVFQGSRRLEAPCDFSLDVLAGSILLLLTPVGIASVVVLASRFLRRPGWFSDKRMAFTVIYTLVPLSIFVAFGFAHEVKLNWTGPLWLAMLPAIAHSLAAEQHAAFSKWPTFSRAWRVTIVAALLLYGGALHYMALGASDMGRANLWRLKTLPVAWEEIGAQVQRIEANVERVTGQEPLIVGMDRYYLSSQMAFYDPDGDGIGETAGRNLFGMDSLMFRYWITPTEAKGRDVILFSLRKGGAIANPSLTRRFPMLGPIHAKNVYKDGERVALIYYRIGYHYAAN